jgi:hypothetical protein
VIFNSNAKLSEDAIMKLSLNCRNLRNISINSRSPLKLVNTILLYFPRLEKFSLKESSFRFKSVEDNNFGGGDFEHHNLKELVICGYSEFQHQLQHIVSCSKLEKITLQMSTNVDGNSLQNLLRIQKSVKFLQFVLFLKGDLEIDQEHVAAIKNYGKNVVRVALQLPNRDSTILESLKEMFKDDFPVSKVVKHKYGYGLLILKKSKDVGDGEFYNEK